MCMSVCVCVYECVCDLMSCGVDDSESAISSEEDEPLPGASVALNGSLSRFAASVWMMTAVCACMFV